MNQNNSSYRIHSPHAAVLIWNYVDRVGVPLGDSRMSSGTDKEKLHKTEIDEKSEENTKTLIISTLSCVSIQTSKSKSQPHGQFNVVLAPSKNWISTITAGSWCCLLMSNEPIDKKDLSKANPKLVKMIGRIESVRCETKVMSNGARQTFYYVSGTDWGSIFNNILYVDNLIASEKDPQNQGNQAAIALRDALFGNSGTPKSFNIRNNIQSIIGIMGRQLKGYFDKESAVNRLSKTIYQFTLPKPMLEYFDFRDDNGKKITNSSSLSQLICLKTGTLISKDKYYDYRESSGFINPFSLQGTHTLWQIIMENSNPALNEMFADINWTTNSGKYDGGIQLALYNRIRPFSFLNFDSKKTKSTKDGDYKSYFQWIRYHELDKMSILSVNAGNNWADKFNFVEIKPNFQEFEVIANWYKQKSQAFDANSFEREGFRPLIFDTKQFPSGGKNGLPNDVNINWNQLEKWAKLMREWYFSTHRMLNGTIVLTGSTEHIAVGNNIRFSADLLNPTPNINKETSRKKQNQYILAHVENVGHSFSVEQNGARTYITTIQFVRGLIVTEANELVGTGMLDRFVDGTSGLEASEEKNTMNTVGTSTELDPNPNRLKGN